MERKYTLFKQELFDLTTLCLSVMVIPGLNFATVVRNATLGGRKAGVWTALGIAVAIAMHCLLACFSVTLLLREAAWLVDVVKFVGAAYLLYLGTKLIACSATRVGTCEGSGPAGVGAFEAFKVGFLIDAMNPFVSFFYLGVFSTVIAPERVLHARLGYSVWMTMLSATWFSLVALLFARGRIRQFLLQRQVWIERGAGAAMYYFAFRVAIAKL